MHAFNFLMQKDCLSGWDLTAAVSIHSLLESKYVCVSPSFFYSLELLKQASDFYFGLGAQRTVCMYLSNLPEDSCSEYHSAVYF